MQCKIISKLDYYVAYPFHQGSCALPKPNPPNELKNSLPKNGKDCWKNTAGLGEFTSVVMVSTSGQEIKRLSTGYSRDYRMLCNLLKGLCSRLVVVCAEATASWRPCRGPCCGPCCCCCCSRGTNSVSPR